MATKSKTPVAAAPKKSVTTKQTKVPEKQASEKVAKTTTPKPAPVHEPDDVTTPDNAIGASAKTRAVIGEPEKAPKAAAVKKTPVKNEAKPTTAKPAAAKSKKAEGGTPVEPYKGNSKLSGGRTRLTAEGERPI